MWGPSLHKPEGIHFGVHFEWFEELWILQFGRRCLVGIFLLILLDQAEDAGVSGNVFLESICLFFCHPSAKNVKWFFWLVICLCLLRLVISMGAGCQLTDIKVP